MKKILYRGGLLQFKIPENDVEEYDEIEGATFYEDGPYTGTVRLNVITLEKPGGSVAER
ncbi:hypothetical protein HUK80_02000 [Flavobacterium sp. MAH-1]|uniref:Uncharacterized protein n=1 Tax=Flavobacterium agri TaxID=2743471 RepID=A0A7Y9C5S4_9FLAO|nr:hypothetical protein [Flavobacterium agri]NUY79653.1 hypothetical protein [Flavobacterium agri]NYA69678.1 hypothetical protein [Flavobacterium agri]